MLDKFGAMEKPWVKLTVTGQNKIHVESNLEGDAYAILDILGLGIRGIAGTLAQEAKLVRPAGFVPSVPGVRHG